MGRNPKSWHGTEADGIAERWFAHAGVELFTASRRWPEMREIFAALYGWQAECLDDANAVRAAVAACIGSHGDILRAAFLATEREAGIDDRDAHRQVAAVLKRSEWPVRSAARWRGQGRGYRTYVVCATLTPAALARAKLWLDLQRAV